MPVVAEALDLDQVAEAAATARAEVIVHQPTAIGSVDMRRFDRSFARTHRFRTEGTDHLLSAETRPACDGSSCRGVAMRPPRVAADRLAGDDGGVWWFVPVADAAEATVTAIERGRRVVDDIVDDDPARVAEWPPALARQLRARRPMRVPRPVARLHAGEAGLVMMTQVRGACDAEAERELGWRPAHPSWREGFLGR